MKRIIGISCLASVLTSAGAFGPYRPPAPDVALENRIVAAVKAQNGSFRLSRGKAGPGYVPPMEWTQGNTLVRLRYIKCESASEGKDTLAILVSSVQISYRTVPSNADEMYLVDPGAASGLRRVFLRRGRYVFIVDAPGESGAVQYAKFFLKQLDSHIAAGG